ncbi:hypothetical protein ACA910_010598 [Epithemia clementina (nom. ined.)]
MKIFCPTILSVGGLLLTLLFGFWCRSFSFDANDYNILVLGQNVTVAASDLHFSPWYMLKTVIQDSYVSSGTLYVTTRDECIEWGDDEDTKWKFVKAITVIIPVIGGILSCMLCMTPCASEMIGKFWHCMALTYIVVLTLFQGLAFLIFQSNACEENPVVRSLTEQLQNLVTQLPAFSGQDTTAFANMTDAGVIWENDCSWDKGSSFNVAAVVCWFLAGVAMLAVGAPRGEEDDGVEGAAAAGGTPDEEVDDDKAEDKKEQPLAGEESGEGGDQEDTAKGESEGEKSGDVEAS